MNQFTNAVRQAIKQQNWYGALTLALTLPDICGYLEEPRAKSRERYIDWWNTYVIDHYRRPVGVNGKYYTFLSGGDAYALRCSYLHEGGAGTSGQKAKEALEQFHFIAPPPWGNIHLNTVDQKLQLQVDIFCEDICGSVERWMKAVGQREDVRSRRDELLTIYASQNGVTF